METRLLLIDTDIFILLAAAGLLERVAELLGFSPSEMRRLPHWRASLLAAKRSKRNSPPPFCTRP